MNLWKFKRPDKHVTDLVELGPNDILFFSFDQPITMEESARMEHLLKDAISSGTRTIVFNKPVKITVIRRTA